MINLIACTVAVWFALQTQTMHASNSSSKSKILRPCLRCGELTELNYCAEHEPEPTRRYRGTVAEHGYDGAWKRLSRRARRLQPFCSDCGATEDLTADHSPEAWQRKAEGLPIRLVDIDVVCRACNSRRGPARGVGVGRGPASAVAKANFPSHTVRQSGG